ncbi:hypothetical protein [Dyadobacter bucti]|uniref:hypothetical protein n=1 Tax=Dyadobacter bucti TaxID=2572203 RepID=UPI001108152B|nr:hypothetical protein [Dyadobacter bucti]
MENGQYKASSLEHLDYCCQLIGELYGKPDISAWTNSDFVRLGYILFKKTQVQISPNTLKRIFGKIKTDVRYYPQKATRDALARYIGYSDWDTFTYARPLPSKVADTPPETYTYPQPAVSETPTPFISRKKKATAGSIMLAALVLAGVVAFWAYKSFFVQNESTAPTLTCTNPVGENPHSAMFVINNMPSLSHTKDHFTIDFGDSKRISLIAGDSLYSHYYEVPGRYLAILKQNGEPLDTASVYLETTGWTATARMMYDTTRVYPIEIQNLFKSGKKSVSAVEVARAGIDTNRTFFVDFINSYVADIDGDNFELLINLKTSPSRPGVRCSQVRVTVFGESSKHLFDVMKPGCVHWTDMQFSEVAKQGETNELHFLGADLHEGGSVGLKVAEKHASISINSKQVYETDYVKPLKKVYGIGVTFSGIGAIHSVVLKDLKTGQTFDGNFQ